ncbi:hypothetical protein [Ferrovum sp. PN-J185]|uniref:hypothetical protein n=1 Tax=Ferrovum sp. PN-J185 TaxID=1356306 RepID=UPI000792C396|nr:hypothetical protein [Ferrovum sp. PN-J185]KXW55478.1 hypothetical protein FV185_12450 [Ferrovum sp. PN-J185]
MNRTEPILELSLETTPKLSGRKLGQINLALGIIHHLRDGNVTLYKRPHSRQWQMRFRLFDKKWHRVSTGYEDLEYAKRKAGDIYDRARFMEEISIPQADKRFKFVANELKLELQKELIEGTGKKIYIDYLAVLDNYLIPFFGKTSLNKIDHKLTASYIELD